MIYLVRHTKVGIHKGICYGQLNVELASSFLQEAEQIKKRLDTLSFTHIYTSPLDRCLALASYCGYPDAVKSEALLELDFGDWEGKKWDSLDMSVWQTDWINNPPPNGESFAQMYERVAGFLGALPEQNILIFTHKGVINCAKSYYRNISLKATFDEELDYGAIVTF